MSEREFDVVVYGATGFTGKLVAAYLAGRTTERVRWAIAGRNADKLRALGFDVPVIVANSNDPASLRAMAARTTVVATTVGPYAKYGEPLVDACVQEGTHYCDITGEPEFVDMTRAKYHSAAQDAGVRVVSCCGFDSIPHDVGAWLCARELPDDAPMTVQGFVRSKGTFSGGTWHSAINAMANIREMGARRPPHDTPTGGRRVGGLPKKVSRNAELGCWAVPLPTIDPEVVLRSAALLPEYGPHFRYGHYARVKKLSTLVVGGVALGGILLGAQFGPTRKRLLQVKSPGDGPPEAQRAKSWFEVVFLGRSERGARAKVIVKGGDPGYTETSKMLAESALCLALDGDRLPERAGVLTTVGAMGQPLLDRLRAAGLTFDVVAP